MSHSTHAMFGLLARCASGVDRSNRTHVHRSRIDRRVRWFVAPTLPARGVGTLLVNTGSVRIASSCARENAK